MALVDISSNIEFIDRTLGIRSIISLFKQKNIPINNKSSLDLFAGDGSFCSYVLGENVKTIDCITYNEKDALKIIQNIPNSNIVIGDTYKEIKNLNKTYDIIFCDNPQNILPNGHCEYFDLLKYIPNLIENEGYFIHNVNVLPYNYNNNSIWGKTRNKFYNLSSTSNIDLDYILKFHKDYFENLNLKVEDIKLIPREKFNDNIYLYFIYYKLKW